MVDEFDEEGRAIADKIRDEGTRDDDNVSVHSNDGSAVLSPNDIPADEQFD